MKHTIPMFAAVVLFTACSGGDDAAKEKAAVTVEESALDASDDQDFILPQPISLASAFQDAGLTYKAGKTNPVTNKNKYAQNIDKLLNLGVYSTDLAYCAINNKSQEARTYLLAIQDLGSKVGMESVFSDKALIEKFDKNLSDKDALTELEDNDLKYLAAVQFAGAWAEGIYLGIDDSKKKGDLGTALVDQMVLLKNTIKALKKHPAKDDKRLQEVIGLFEDVLSTYEGLESVKKANKNINFEVPKLSTEEFDQLANKVTVLRNSIVSPSK
jgi:hypothetical protein